MKRNEFRKIILSLLVAVFVFSHFSCTLLASEKLPYDSYNYDYWGNIVYTPAPYVPGRMISGKDLELNGKSIGDFSSPSDICMSNSGEVYIADKGNNRIVVLDKTLEKVKRIVDSFDNNGVEDTFNSPSGVCVSSKNCLYIADTMNKRIVILDIKDMSLIKIVDNPTSDILESGFVFTPLKVSVDYADRIYCVAQNMFEGIMVFESDGEFTGFFGTISVKITLWEKFWKKLATKEERSKSQLFIPTEFTGIDVDEAGFVYATNIDVDGLQAVRRLNPKGQDVIKKGENENLGGDLEITGSTEYAGASQITDVVYRGKGIYSLLDRRRGRVFTYDHEGNLLYVFGGLGSQEGTFVTPAAIEEADGVVFVVDSYRNMVMCFDETRYGQLINEAVALRYDGDETKAVEKWEEVLKLNEDFELACSGIGKAYLTAGDNEMAMHYLKLGMNREYYAISYKRYRNEILSENLSGILTGIVIVIIAFVIGKRLWKAYKQKEEAKDE